LASEQASDGVCSGPTQTARHDNPVDNGSWGYAALWVSDAAVVKRILDVRFISSLPVMQQPAYKVWADKRPVQIVWAVR